MTGGHYEDIGAACVRLARGLFWLTVVGWGLVGVATAWVLIGR